MKKKIDKNIIESLRCKARFKHEYHCVDVGQQFTLE